MVSYLNTAPLVWGMVHGEQRGLFDLSFAIPAECADRLQTGLADIGIVPAVELNRQKLEIIPGAGIACQFQPGWIIKAEYLYYDVGTHTSVGHAVGGVQSQFDFVGTGNLLRLALTVKVP